MTIIITVVIYYYYTIHRSALDDLPFYLFAVSKAENPIFNTYIWNLLSTNGYLNEATNGYLNEWVRNICTKNTNTTTVSTANTPPFFYSFQCSSSLISSYIIVFMYIYSALGTFLPIAKLKLMLLSTNGYLEYIQKRIPLKLTDFLKEYIFSLNEESVQESFKAEDDDVNRIVESEFDVDGRGKYWFNKSIRFNGGNVISQMCTHITVMLTFGLSYPILGIMICIFVFFDVVVWRMSIGRYMKIISSNRETYDVNLKILENSSIDSYKCVIRSWWIMQIIIGLYWSLMIFDVVGSERSSVQDGINGSLVVFFSYTFMFIIADKFIGNEEYHSYSFVGFLRYASFYLHSFIWSRIFKIGSMRSIINQEVVSSDDNLQVNRKSSQTSVMNETSNPLSSSIITDNDL